MGHENGWGKPIKTRLRLESFLDGFYYMVTHMASALYTKDELRRWYKDDEKKNKQMWELNAVSDMAYTILFWKTMVMFQNKIGSFILKTTTHRVLTKRNLLNTRC